MHTIINRHKIIFFIAVILIVILLLYFVFHRSEVPADFICIRTLEVMGKSVDIQGSFVGGDSMFAGFSYKVYENELRITIYARSIGFFKIGSGNVLIHIEEDTTSFRRISIQTKNTLVSIWEPPSQV